MLLNINCKRQALVLFPTFRGEPPFGRDVQQTPQEITHHRRGKHCMQIASERSKCDAATKHVSL